MVEVQLCTDTSQASLDVKTSPSPSVILVIEDAKPTFYHSLTAMSGHVSHHNHNNNYLYELSKQLCKESDSKLFEVVIGVQALKPN